MQNLELCSPKETEAVETVCCYCSVQCGVSIEGEEIRGNHESPVSLGKLCQKGTNAYEPILHSDRLTTPLIRKNGRLEPCSWEEALDEVVRRFRSIQKNYTSSSIGVYGGGSLTNEKAYLLGKFARIALKTPNIDYNGRYCMSSAASAMNLAFGIDRGLPFPLQDIEHAECIILVGANIAECQPMILPYFRTAQKRGAILIVVDPRKTMTARLADIHLQIHPGTDAWLMNGILHVLIRDHLIDHSFIMERTNGFAAICNEMESYDPRSVEKITEINSSTIEQLATMIATNRTIILTARGIEQRSSGVDQVLSCINLVLATGNIGNIGTGYGSITGQANGLGGRELGQKADQLPGYRSICKQEDRQYIANVWGVPEKWIPGEGLSAYEMFDSMIEGDMKGLIVLASNPVVSSPDRKHVMQAFESLETLVVVDLFLSETALLADIVLPGSGWTEDTGTTTNLEGRVLLRHAVHAPPGSAMQDWEILCRLAAKFGYGKYFPYKSTEQIFEEIRIATKDSRSDYSRLTYEQIQSMESFETGGIRRLFTDAFFHQDGKARFFRVIPRRPAEMPNREYPFYLTTGRISQHYLTGTITKRTKFLQNKYLEPFVEVHPSIAEHYEIADGERIVLKSRRGKMEIRVKLTATIRPDTMFVPFHWEFEKSVNQLTVSTLDPISKMPEFKSCAVKIEKIK